MARCAFVAIACWLLIGSACASEPQPEPTAAQSPAPPADAGPVHLAPMFRVGQRATLSMRTTKESSTAAGVTERKQAEAHVLVEVIEENDDHWVIRWSTKLPEALRPADAAEAALLSTLAETPPMDLMMGFAGDLLGIRNWEQFRDESLRLAEVTLKHLHPDQNEETRARAMDFMRSILKDRQATETTGLQHTAWYFLPIGTELTVGEPVTNEQVLPNPLGGDPLPATAVYSLTAVDPQSRAVTFSYSQTITPEAVKQLALQAVQRLVPEHKLSVEELARDCDLRDELVATYDPATGWITDATWRRVVKMGPDNVTHTKSFRLVELIANGAPAEDPDAVTNQPADPPGSRGDR